MSNKEIVEVLRKLGHDAAADVVGAMSHEDNAEQQQQQQQVRKPGLSGIPMLSSDVGIDRQAQADGQVIAEALRRSGAGQSWVSAGLLISDPRHRRPDR